MVRPGAGGAVRQINPRVPYGERPRVLQDRDLRHMKPTNVGSSVLV